MNEKTKILLVDDDANFLGFLKEGLEKSGFRPSPCSSGAEALRRITGEKWDLLVSDYFMPGLDGPSLYRLVKSIRPELASRTIFVTGAPFDRKVVEFLSDTNCIFLNKPFPMERLLEAINKSTSTISKN